MRFRFGNRSKLFLFGSLGILVIAALGALGLSEGWIRFNYPSRAVFDVRGIDISHHNGKIDWTELSYEELDFVIIKATEGGDYRDPLFAANHDSATKSGYNVGAYHFYRFCTDNATQLQNFLSAMRGRHFELAPTIDLEFGGNCRYPGTSLELQRKIDSFVVALRDSTGTNPILYATQDFNNEVLVGRPSTSPLWIRDIFWQPTLVDDRPWAIWQYANRGRLRGIRAFVDLNTLRSADLPMVSHGWKTGRQAR